MSIGNRPFSLAWWFTVVLAVLMVGAGTGMYVILAAAEPSQTTAWFKAVFLILLIPATLFLVALVASTVRDLRYRSVEHPDSAAPRER